MKLVDALLAQKLPHAQILRAALKSGEDHKKVSLKLAYTADAPLAQQYRNDIRILMAYLGLLSLTSISALVWVGFETTEMIYYIMAGVAVLLTALMMYALMKNRAGAYLGIISLTALSCFQALKMVKEAPAIVIVCLVLNLILIAMAARLKFKLFPNQNYFNTKKDETGCLAF